MPEPTAAALPDREPADSPDAGPLLDEDRVDIATATLDAHLETLAYQGAFGTAVGVVTASLLDFLR